MFEDFFGNERVQTTLERMIAGGRIPHTILLAGAEGVGKATLARRFAARLLGDREKIERDDLSLPHNQELLADREKWPGDRRVEEPLLFASHPDFVTFPPDGPLRQISIQQMRLLKDRARFKPLRGDRRVFLIDRIDQANEQAANSLLKTLEEPPEHLVLVLTAENPYDLLPTIRSRAVPLYLTSLPAETMREFCTSRQLDDAERRMALAAGSPGVAVTLDLALYDRRRAAMLGLLQAASGAANFGAWLRYADEIAAARSEKLDHYLKVLYGLLRDLLVLQQGGDELRNIDKRAELAQLAARVSFQWLRAATRKVDELSNLVRRNIQKSIALDALILDLRTTMG
jgi:DNA polymerase-3 subunit delta'